MKASLSDARGVPTRLPARFKRGCDLASRDGLPSAVEARGTGLRIERYGRRFWAVWDGLELVCVTVYRKGARSVVALVTALMEEAGRGSN